MNWEPFITCAVTGGGATRGSIRDLPITPARSPTPRSTRPRRRGDRPLHVRHPETGAPRRDSRSTARSSSGSASATRSADQPDHRHGRRSGRRHGRGGRHARPGQRFRGAGRAHQARPGALPDICTLDCGSMNFGDGDTIYVAPPTYLRAGAEEDPGAGGEAGAGGVRSRPARVRQPDGRRGSDRRSALHPGLSRDPLGRNRRSGDDDGLPPAAPAWLRLVGLRHRSDGDAMLAQAMVLGGNLSVGLEDNLYLSRGVLRIERPAGRPGRRHRRALGGQLAGPDEVRRRLGLGPQARPPER